ncbi:hypothetical protein N9W02_02730 [Flavobacteriaceae bacterium]|nr:hypothetical protein [Flavobacteriaceae bacterium]
MTVNPLRYWPIAGSELRVQRNRPNTTLEVSCGCSTVDQTPEASLGCSAVNPVQAANHEKINSAAYQPIVLRPIFARVTTTKTTA